MVLCDNRSGLVQEALAALLKIVAQVRVS